MTLIQPYYTVAYMTGLLRNGVKMMNVLSSEGNSKAKSRIKRYIWTLRQFLRINVIICKVAK
jgi:hypothetical protein